MKEAVLSNLVHLYSRFNTLSALLSRTREENDRGRGPSIDRRRRRLPTQCSLQHRQNGHRHPDGLHRRHLASRTSHEGVIVPAISKNHSVSHSLVLFVLVLQWIRLPSSTDWPPRSFRPYPSMVTIDVTSNMGSRTATGFTAGEPAALDKFVQKCTNTLVFSMNYRILQMDYLYNPDS